MTEQTTYMLSSIINLIIAVWVFIDSRHRNSKYPLLRSMHAFIFGVFGLVLYLFTRPKPFTHIDGRVIYY